MALVAVVPLVVVTWSAVDIATGHAEDASKEGLRREAALHAAMVALWTEDQARMVLSWPQLYGGDRLLSMSQEAQRSFPTAVYRGTPNAVTALMVDGDGVVVGMPVYATVPGERPVGSASRAQELVERLPLSDALAGPDVVHLGDPYFPQGATTPSIPFAVLAAGAPSAAEQRVLGVEIALDLREELLAATTSTHAVAVLDRNGAPLLGGDHPLVRPERLRPLLGTDQAVDFSLDDGDVRGAIVLVPYTGWSLVVAEPGSVVLASATDIRRNVLVFLALATLAAVLVALATASGLSRPVERLRDAALEVAAGRFGESTRIARRDEIGELASAFDHMRERLRTSHEEIRQQQDEIEAFNRELQERVLDRTRALEEAQQELVRAGQLAAVAELGAGLAHELNNPLAAVLGLAQLLRLRDPEDPDLADLEREAARCREVVVTLQRVQAPEIEPRDLPAVDAESVVTDVEELVAGSFRQRGVTLRVAHPIPGTMRADPAAAARVVAQVLNALRAGLEPGAVVDLEGRTEGPWVVLVASADRQVAEHPDRHDDWMASGHGLWVAHQLLHRMGGRLEDDGQIWRIALPSV